MPHAQRNTHAPSRWPSDVQYLRAVSYPSSLQAAAALQYIKGNRTAPLSSTRPPVAIRRIENTAHPAYGQMGLFAIKKIPPRTHIIDYLGEVHTDERPNSDYDLSLYRMRGDDGSDINIGVSSSNHFRPSDPAKVNIFNLNKSTRKIDAQHMGNEARFINDYRGIRTSPNALFRERRSDEGELRMSVWSGDSEAIKKGDEILVSYGKPWWQARLHQK